MIGLWGLAPAALAQADTGVQAKALAAQAPCGRLEVVDGQAVLFLWGSAEDQGYAEGFLLAQDIQDTFDDFVLGEATGLNGAIWNLRLRKLFEHRIQTSPLTDARIKGLVRGIAAALPEEQRRIQQLGRPLDELDFVGVLALIDLVGFLCSSFVAWDETLETGPGPLVGRNLDYRASDNLLKSTVVKVHLANEQHSAWLEIGWPGFMGCLTGINAAGISVAIHDVKAKAPEAPIKVKPRADALAMLMDQLDSPEGLPNTAAELLREHRYAFGMNAMLGWAGEQPGGAVLEVDSNAEQDRGVSIRGPEDAPYVVCTNHHRSRQTAISCGRYAALDGGCETTLSLEDAALDFERSWELISRASNAKTLFRCAFDLERGTLRMQRRSRLGGEMIRPVNLNWKTLLSQAEQRRDEAR